MAPLRYILQTEFAGEACAWCYLSAGLSFSLLFTVASGMGLDRLRSAAAPGAGALVTSLAALYFGFADVGSSSAYSPTELAYSVRLNGKGSAWVGAWAQLRDLSRAPIATRQLVLRQG